MPTLITDDTALSASDNNTVLELTVNNSTTVLELSENDNIITVQENNIEFLTEFVRGLQGPPGARGETGDPSAGHFFVAGEDIEINKAVQLKDDGLVYCIRPEYALNFIGICKRAVVKDVGVEVMLNSQKIKDDGFNFISGERIFFDDYGTLTQKPHPTVYNPIGIALSTNEVLILNNEPVFIEP